MIHDKISIMEKKPHRKRKILIISAIVLLVVAGGTFFIIHLVKGPANGTVIDLISQPIQKSDQILSSKYFSAQYPGRYGIAQTQQIASSSLKSWTLVAHQEPGVGEGAQLSITVTNLPADGVKGDSAYSLYNAFPDKYTLKPATYGKDKGYDAKRKDTPYQRTILWPHKTYLLTISLTASNESDLVNNELQSFVKSVTWAQ
jgi:hypothetical protein